MNDREQPSPLSEQDAQLLAQIDQALSQSPQPQGDNGIAGFSFRLASAVPQPQPAFREQLEDSFVGEMANPSRGRRTKGGQRVWMWGLVALLAVLVFSGGWYGATTLTGPTPAALDASATPNQAAAAITATATLMPTATLQPTVPPSPTALNLPILRSDQLNIGVVTHLYYTNRERVLTLTNIAGFDMVRQQVVWKDIEGPQPGQYAWDELDNIINDVADHNVKLLINITQAPSFYTSTGTNGLPDDPQTMGNFVAQMAQRYGNKIAAYEIWNEQNLAKENGGHVAASDAGRYVELLAECYRRIKQINPSALVLSGAPSSTGVNDPGTAVSDMAYLEAMYTYRDGMIRDYFDAQAVHPGGTINPPETLWPERPGPGTGCAEGNCWQQDPTFYFRHVENVRQLMQKYKLDDHQIWITEFGWATANTTPGYEFGNSISFQQQSAYITGAIKWANERYRDEQGNAWVGAMFLWNLNFAVLKSNEGDPTHEQASFGILNGDWSPRQAYLDLQGFLQDFKSKRDQ